MASHFEIVGEEYIEELKGKSQKENAKNSTEIGRTFSKSGRMKETYKQISKSTRAMSSTKHCRNFMHLEIQ